LPTLNLPGLEPRGALWLDIDVVGAQGGTLQVINTHLGLVPREQRAQAAHLTGPEWLGLARRRGPLLVVGDLNAPPTSSVYRAFRRGLLDVQLAVNGARQLPTFPSAFPMLRIDHVFASSHIEVKRVWVAADPVARKASDHLPLIVDFDPAGAAPAA
jgi:endonuclease/exonuclease/phosphatase family metal-dependent hydrolase